MGAWWVIGQIRRAGKLTIVNGSHGKVIARLDVDSWDVEWREHPVLRLRVISDSVDAGLLITVSHGGAGLRLW